MSQDPVNALCEVCASAQFVLTTICNDIGEVVDRKKRFEHLAAATTIVAPLTKLKNALGDASARVNGAAVERPRMKAAGQRDPAEVFDGIPRPFSSSAVVWS